MNRLQQKCVIASAGLHLSLLLVLVVGPAFSSSKNKPEDNMPILDFIPFKTVDAMVSGGGNPNGRLPQAPPPQAPKPPTPKVEEPKPTPEPPKVAEPREPIKDPAPESLVPSTERKAHKVEVSTKVVKRKPVTQTNDTSDQEDKQAREDAKRRQRAADLLSKAAGDIENGVTSAGINVKDFKGPGGGGVPYANFYQAVKSVYARAWVLPDGISDDDATTAVEVTIARDGKVVSSRITRSSGDAAVDRSVQVVLDRVKRAAPLPENAKEDERTVTINFNVKAKRALG